MFLTKSKTFKMAIGAHHGTKPKTNEWITPPEIIQSLGPFDLDPCAAKRQPWPCANNQYTVDDDGLAKTWFGRVWLNPPYSSHSLPFMLKMSDHGNGIALIFARTETKMFFKTVWDSPTATGILFIKGGLLFTR